MGRNKSPLQSVGLWIVAAGLVAIPWDGISSVPGIRNIRGQPCTNSGELRSQRRLQRCSLPLYDY
jgi:hypothetical protein